LKFIVKRSSKTIWNKVLGAAFGIKPVGLAARDTLRLEMGFAFTEMTLIPPHRLKQD
jgi:glycine cleavage system aminomethyltransferase T